MTRGQSQGNNIIWPGQEREFWDADAQNCSSKRTGVISVNIVGCLILVQERLLPEQKVVSVGNQFKDFPLKTIFAEEVPILLQQPGRVAAIPKVRTMIEPSPLNINRTANIFSKIDITQDHVNTRTGSVLSLVGRFGAVASVPRRNSAGRIGSWHPFRLESRLAEIFPQLCLSSFLGAPSIISLPRRMTWQRGGVATSCPKEVSCLIPAVAAAPCSWWDKSLSCLVLLFLIGELWHWVICESSR